MFVLGDMESDPGTMLAMQREQHAKLMGDPAVEPFSTYAGLTGKGAVLKGRILGIRTTVRIFACHRDGTTAIITEHCPDVDLKHVRAGFALVEKSFTLKAGGGGTEEEGP
jgi:hypothetical protein